MLVQTVETARLAAIGLGYVGLSVAVEFGKRHPVVGFDVNPARIEALRQGVDATLEVRAEENSRRRTG
jgi:UDP-N-acetyl-D-galactosamine dehydrogenase